MTQDDELLQLKAQVNALAQAWLRLAAAVEVSGALDAEALDGSLRNFRWQEADQKIDAEGRKTLSWLADNLAAARESRSEPPQ